MIQPLEAVFDGEGVRPHEPMALESKWVFASSLKRGRTTTRFRSCALRGRLD